MKKIFLYSILLLLSSVFAACEKNPVNRLINPSPGNSSDIWSGKWVLYDDEMKTNGTIMLFNEGTSLDFNCADNPYSGKKCIRYSWDGSPVLTYRSLPAHTTDYLQKDFTGFSLICAKTTDGYSSGAKDLSLAGYTRITFRARGSLNSNVYLRVEANSEDANVYKLASGATGVWMGTVTSDWKQYSLTIDNTVNSLKRAKDFVKFIFRYDEDGNPDTPNAGTGNGGTVYIDDIELTK